ncbi:MAG TPA: hypothetical protein DD387_03975 [Lachnoclostridium sp.]|nr:hypothetical protein [Lachnoclostridium sp.]
MDNRTLTEKLADFSLGLVYDDIPELAKIKAKDAVIDYLGCILGAADSAEAAIIDDLVFEAAAPAEATLVGSWKKSSAHYAAMSNAYRCHILEFDDGVGGMHTGTTILPAAIAAAEKYGASGKELIRAIVLGIEAACRISLAAGVSQNKYWHSTGTCGVFGAAMASGIIMGLDRDQLVWSLGNAGTMAAGLWQFNQEGAMTKYLHCAKAAADGLLASMLAKRGYTGARKIIEGEKGFIVSHSEEKNPERFFETLGNEYMIEMLSIKPFPSCSHTHAAISASLQLKEKYDIKAEEIDKIIITTYKDAPITARNNKTFMTSREAKFSISGGAAAALLRGRVDKNTFSMESIVQPELLDLVAKTEIQIDDEMTQNYPRQWAAAVEVQTARGSFKIVEKEPWGDLRDAMPLDKLKVKYKQLAEGVISDKAAELLWERCLKLEDLDNVRDLFAGL